MWIHEFDYQLVKADLESVEDVTIGWGILGRLHKGAKVSFERTKVNDEVWLPARVHIAGTGRALIFRSFSLDCVDGMERLQEVFRKTEENLK